MDECICWFVERGIGLCSGGVLFFVRWGVVVCDTLGVGYSLRERRERKGEGEKGGER